MTKHIDPKQFEPYRRAGVTLMPLRCWWEKTKDGKPAGKLPHKGWRTDVYEANAVIAGAKANSSNVGVRIDDGWLVLDFDPRAAFGDDELQLACDEYGIDRQVCPEVETGGGGRHLYLRVPKGTKVRNRLPGILDAVECKAEGRFVVAAGSLHPSGRSYGWVPDRLPLAKAPDAPEALLEAIRRPERAPATTEPGEITNDQLRAMLAALPVTDFSTNADWEPVMMAANSATRGAGLDVFLEWSLSDPAFADQSEVITARWNSLDSNKVDGRTIATLNKVVRKYDPKATVPNTDPSDEFDGEDIPQEESGPKRKRIMPTPFVLRNPALLEPRDWIYRPVYLRKCLSLTTAQGGVGKSRLAMTEAVAMTSGKALLGIEPLRRLRGWYWNGEDTEEEIDRGLHAICKYYDLKPEDVNERLYRDSGLNIPIKLARTKDGLTQIAEPLVKEIIDVARELKLDFFMIDPFVASHAAAENVAEAMEPVAKKWATIANACNISIGIVHHNRKSMGGTPGGIEDSRGSTALINAARVRRAINKMTESQAKGAGIDLGRRGFYMSADMSNTNVMKPATALTWYKLESVDLENMTIDQDSDEIGVPVTYEYSPIAEVETTSDQREEVLEALNKRDDWRADTRSPDWIGFEIGRQLDLIMAGDSHAAERKRVRKLISNWLNQGALIEYEKEDAKRRKRAFIKVAPVDTPVTGADWSK